ncbi:MAG: DMT family transporter [Pseudomonadota bacterium]
MTKSSVSKASPPAFGSGALMVLGGGLLIGLAPIGLRLGLGELGPQAIAFWRFVFSIPLAFALVIILKKRAPQKPDIFIFLAAMFFAFNIALWHAALSMTSVANATFLVNLGNIGAGFVAWLVLRERPSKIWFAAIAFAALGAGALSLGGGGAQNQTNSFQGDFLALGAAIVVACYVVTAKMGRRTLSAIDAIFWLCLFEAGFAAIAVLATGEAFLPNKAVGFAAPLFLAVAVQIGGQGLIVAGLGHTSAAIGGVMIVAQPVVAAIISWRLFGEVLLPVQLMGCALIIIAIIAAQTPSRPSAAKPDAPAAK